MISPMTIEYFCKISSPWEGKDKQCVGQNVCPTGKKYPETICPYIEARIGFDPYIL
jgi:hypothetical protein